jgi:hypothetical protein
MEVVVFYFDLRFECLHRRNGNIRRVIARNTGTMPAEIRTAELWRTKQIATIISRFSNSSGFCNEYLGCAIPESL